MNTLREYIVQQSVDEWIPWGGITLPHVLEQKDGSYLSIIKYEPYSAPEHPEIHLPNFPRGWAISTERQHYKNGVYGDYLIITWNPFYEKITRNVENLRTPGLFKGNTLHYFGEEMQEIVKELGKEIKVKLLEYQQIIDFLSFSLDFEYERVEMPEEPLYIDTLLSQDVAMSFGNNAISYIDPDGKVNRVILTSILGHPDLHNAFDQLNGVTYRYCRRLLCMPEDYTKDKLKEYTERWCKGRQYMLDGLLVPMTEGELFGPYAEAFIFCVPEDKVKEMVAYIRQVLSETSLSFVNEEFNLKEIWWGMCPGNFRANVNPLPETFTDIGSLLLHSEEIVEESYMDKVYAEIVNGGSGG